MNFVAPTAGWRDAIERFSGLDWTFADAQTRGGLHSIHPYPARFIPQIPRALIELFQPLTGAPVLDPFCGSGTTLVECQAAGVPSFGIDLNPVATLISDVKIHPPDREIGCEAARLAAEAAAAGSALPDIPRLRHWFTPGAAAALAGLTSRLAEVPEGRSRNALRVALSRIVVRVSRQDSDTRYAAVDRAVGARDVYALFVESARTLDAAFLERTVPGAESGVLTKDILSVEPGDLPWKFGLIVTSPPYPNAYEYWLYHKYRMYWLGEDPLAVRASEIGARTHYFRKNPATAGHFRTQMSHCFGLFRAVTVPGAIACVVIGRSIIRGEAIDNAALLRAAAAEHGFSAIARALRRIPAGRKSFNPAHGGSASETVMVFRRE